MISQLGIVATGVVAVWLSQDSRETRRRWACLFGMAGQPFWIYAAVDSGQWGMFAVTLLYTWGWARGVWVNWVVPAREDGEFAHKKSVRLLNCSSDPLRRDVN